jgi:hypothetical protein
MQNTTTPHLSRAQRRTRHHARQAQCPPNIHQNPRLDSDTPCWLPTVADPLGLPQLVLESLTRIIRPAYRAMVLEAPDELERTIGNSIVYLTWLELVNQIRLANALADPTSPAAILHDPDKLTDRCLKLVTAKCQTAGLMLRLRVATDARNRQTEPQTPSKLENQQPVDQLNCPVPLTPFSPKTPGLENQEAVDQRRQSAPRNPSSPSTPGKLESKKSVDQLNRPVSSAPSSPGTRTKLETKESVDQLNRPVSSAPSSPGTRTKLETKQSVDQLNRSGPPNPSSRKDFENE